MMKLEKNKKNLFKSFVIILSIALIPGLQVKVYNNNVEGALKVFKKKVKDSGLMMDLK